MAEGAKNVMKLLGSGKVTEKRAHSEVDGFFFHVYLNETECLIHPAVFLSLRSKPLSPGPSSFQRVESKTRPPAVFLGAAA